MKVLITGASGKVGRMVRRALAGRHEMRCYDLAPIEACEGEMVVGDILDRPALAQAMTGMDALIHLAYGREPGAGREVQELLSFDVNAKGTYYVAQAAAAAGIRHAVYASSLSLYEGHMPAPGVCFTELEPPLPLHSYALTKYFGEEIFRACAAQGLFSVISLRLTLPTEMEEWEAVRQQHPESGI
ncbi:MAG TPA: NAD(P)-dependent oxidoreductase, partial [Armatimonadota bacterium]|nr:NAD(P)-dependent oxidoreductase [Armatimonadota bacterium]